MIMHCSDNTQMLMSVLPILTTVPTTARTHMALTLAAVVQGIPWTRMDSRVMVR